MNIKNFRVTGFTLIILLCSYHCVTATVKPEFKQRVEKAKKGSSKDYTVKGKEHSFEDLKILFDQPYTSKVTKDYYQSIKTLTAFGTIFGMVGGGTFGWNLGRVLAGGDSVDVMWIIGGALGGVVGQMTIDGSLNRESNALSLLSGAVFGAAAGFAGSKVGNKILGKLKINNNFVQEAFNGLLFGFPAGVGNGTVNQIINKANSAYACSTNYGGCYDSTPDVWRSVASPTNSLSSTVGRRSDLINSALLWDSF